MQLDGSHTSTVAVTDRTLGAVETILPKLEAVIAQGSVERRVKALDHLTSVFLSASDGFSEAQTVLLDELFIKLSAEIESAARRALALRLADCSHAPPKIVRSLASDDAIEVARPILERSDCLTDRAIIEIITTKSQEYLLAVSTRRSIGPAITDILVNRGNRAVVHNTARNAGARFSERGYEKLVERARGDDELTESVGSRADIPRYLFVELVAKASETVRAKLEMAQPEHSQEIRQIVSEVAGLVRKSPMPGTRDYAAATEQIKGLREQRALGPGEIEGFAVAGLFEQTVVAIATLGNLPIEIVERAMMQDRPELLLFVVRAVGLTWSATKAVFALRKSQPGISDVTMDQVLANFEKLRPSTARQAVRFYLLRNARLSE